MVGRVAILLTVCVASALAACPNQCSGHGSCIQNDKCVCYSLWTGYDCSQRTCPSGNAWSINAADPHTYAECSNQGNCDRTTGICGCFPGFEGYNCARLSCPNKCSGQGTCMPLSATTNTIPYASTNWDSGRIQTCTCDAGFYGPDCSFRRCPTGDDPLTLCSTANKNQVQEVRLTLGSGVQHDATTIVEGTYTISTDTMDVFGTSSAATFQNIRATTGQIPITYQDAWSAQYVTHAVTGILSNNAATLARDSMKVSLETVPEQKVLGVTVQTAMTSTGDANNGGIANVIQRRWLVTFNGDTTNSNNVGLQNPLICPTAYSCAYAGCQPLITMPFLYRYAGTPMDVALGVTISSFGTSSGNRINFYTNSQNSDTNSRAGSFLRLNPASQPQMPQGVAVDTAVTASSLYRYDMRIIVAVIDPQDGIDTPVDVFYTRVIVGHTNITSLSEAVGSTTAGQWISSATFTTTLNGFTFNGPIPLNTAGTGASTSVPVPGAPGVYLSFDNLNVNGGQGRNYVTTDGAGRWYEILIKLPSCTVTPVIQASQVKGFGVSTYITPVDTNVENVECSNRGTCTTSVGKCKCFTGYYGVACQSQTALV